MQSFKVCWLFRNHPKQITHGWDLREMRWLFSGKSYRVCYNKGIGCFRDLCNAENLCSFSELTSEFGSPKAHLFCYYQVWHCASTLFSDYPSCEDLFDVNLKPTSFISKIHFILMSFDEGTTSKTKKGMGTGTWQRGDAHPQLPSGSQSTATPTWHSSPNRP